MHGKNGALLRALLAAFIACSYTVSSQYLQYDEKLFPDADVSYNAGFGYSIALSPNANFLVIGAPFDTVAWVSEVGSVSVFTRSGSEWALASKIVPPNASYAHFGVAVAVSEDRLIVGAPDDIFGGTVYAYELQAGQWVYQTSFSKYSGNYMGGTLALDGDLLLVGTSNPTGTMFTYTWSNGYWSDYLTLYGTYTNLWHRNTVALSANWALITSYAENDGQGAAYLWPRSGTYIDSNSMTRLSAVNPQWYSYLGKSAAFVSDNVVALGSSGISSIYIFSYTFGYGWSQTNILTTPLAGGQFGKTLSFSNNHLLAGDPINHAAVVFSFSGSEWSAPYEVPKPDGVSLYGSYGGALLIRGSEIFVGDPSPYDSWGVSGVVFAFNIDQDALPSPSLPTPILPQNPRVYRNVHGKSNNLGISISAERNLAAISQPSCSEYSQYNKPCGKVYLVETSQNGWSLVQYFQYLGRVPYAYFGTNVLLKNGWLLVTSEALYDSESGIEQSAVYGFRYSPAHNRYVRNFSLSPPLDQAYQLFGKGLAMDGNFTMISAPFATVDNMYDKGRVYILHYPKSIDKVNGYHYLEIKCPTDGDEYGFGRYIAARRGIVAISADSTNGRLFVYSYDGITSATLIQTIRDNFSSSTLFGFNMIFEGTTLFATSLDVSYPSTTGAVYHFNLGEDKQFYQVNRITPNDDNPVPYFGMSLAYDPKNKNLVVGATPNWSCGWCTDNEPSAVYVLHNTDGNNWEQTKHKLGASDGLDSFGASVAVNHAGIIVGAPFDSVNGQNRGAVYFLNP